VRYIALHSSFARNFCTGWGLFAIGRNECFRLDNLDGASPVVSGHRHGISNLKTERHAAIRIADVQDEGLVEEKRPLEWQREVKSHSILVIGFNSYVLRRLEGQHSIAKSR